MVVQRRLGETSDCRWSQHVSCSCVASLSMLLQCIMAHVTPRFHSLLSAIISLLVVLQSFNINSFMTHICTGSHFWPPRKIVDTPLSFRHYLMSFNHYLMSFNHYLMSFSHYLMSFSHYLRQWPWFSHFIRWQFVVVHPVVVHPVVVHPVVVHPVVVHPVMVHPVVVHPVVVHPVVVHPA